MDGFSVDIAFAKRSLDDDQRLVGGWASITKAKGGETVADTQGDVIATKSLRKALHGFLDGNRTLGLMHLTGDDGKAVPIGKVVEAVVFGDGMQPPDYDGPEGLWIVAYVENDEAWRAVKDGEFTGFSIGGRGKRRRLDA